MKLCYFSFALLISLIGDAEFNPLNSEYHNKIPHRSADGRISGGDKTNNRFPKILAYIKLYDRLKKVYVPCTGTLIDEHWILTSKRCLLNKDNATVILGVDDIANPGQFTEDVESIPNFIVNSYVDLGLIKLRNPWTGFGVAELPVRADWPKDYDGDYGLTYGWGYSDDPTSNSPGVLRYVFSSIQRCPSSYCVINETCISGSGGKGTCFGDSGAPLYQGTTIVGVAARTHDTCGANEPNRYVLINRYLDWISDITGIIIP